MEKIQSAHNGNNNDCHCHVCSDSVSVIYHFIGRSFKGKYAKKLKETQLQNQYTGPMLADTLHKPKQLEPILKLVFGKFHLEIELWDQIK